MAKKPTILGDYTRVYLPKEDVFDGPDCGIFKAGETYKNWVPNDHVILKGNDGRWHGFGITHPAPPNYKGADFDVSTIHAGEWQLFHAVSKVGKLCESLFDDSWKDEAKVLPPDDRPKEMNECHSPYIVFKDGLYHMIYGPNDFRLAVSKDLYIWEIKGTVFSDGNGSRDPNIIYENGKYIIYYLKGKAVYARTSDDLYNWSEPTSVFEFKVDGEPESPVVVMYDDIYYLFVCRWDEDDIVYGAYDYRTYVYSSKDPMNFNDSSLVTELRAHAPEVFCDSEGNWYISSAEYPKTGINIAKLEWV